MALKFYYGSGSPFAWKVWLALEHKQIPYEPELLSFSAGDTRKPEFLAVSPRGKVPAIVDDGFALHESNAIVEYLEERYPDRPLLPGDARGRAVVRRISAEADGPLFAAARRLLQETLHRAEKEHDPAGIAEAQAAALVELERWDAMLTAGYLAGELSLADFAAYPQVRLLKRIDERQPHHGLGDRIPSRVAAWVARIAALPYHDKTFPPHWRG